MRSPGIGLWIAAFAAFASFSQVTAQTPPQAISYQALVRDAAGQPVRNQPVGVLVRLHWDSAGGPLAYAETQIQTTNGFGNVNLEIGRGSVFFGSFVAVDWSRAIFIETGVDLLGGTAFTILGTTQLLSVPYAMYSGRSAAASNAPNASEIRDADSNTKVSTERSANENLIRFDINGSEKMRLQGSRLEFPNSGMSVFIGDSAGTTDDLSDNVNAFVGFAAGKANTTGDNNAFFGYRSGERNTTGASNTFSGSWSGSSNTTGNFNAFFGFNAGRANTSGWYNTFLGYAAGLNNTTGFQNTYSGYQAGHQGTTGGQNTFSGFQAGYNNTIGGANTFIGSSAGLSNSTGSGNSFFGNFAGQANTTGLQNTFSGYEAGFTNTTGSNNLFLGHRAGYLNNAGGSNTFLGPTAGYSNTTGVGNTFSGTGAGRSNITGNGNTFSGNQSGYGNTTGIDNTFSGSGAGYNNTTGRLNTFYGSDAGINNGTGDRNTYIGFRSGTSGLGNGDSGNVFIGSQAGSGSSGISNRLYIDNSDTTAPLIWGNFSTNDVRISGDLTVTGTFTNPSDRRLKQDIQPLPNALDGVGRLNGVYYHWKPSADPSCARQIGVIAQDVEKVYPELVKTNENGYKSVDYPKLSAVLIEAVKEQQRVIAALRAEALNEKQAMENRFSEIAEKQAKMEQLLLSQLGKNGDVTKVAGR